MGETALRWELFEDSAVSATILGERVARRASGIPWDKIAYVEISDNGKSASTFPQEGNFLSEEPVSTRSITEAVLGKYFSGLLSGESYSEIKITAQTFKGRNYRISEKVGPSNVPAEELKQFAPYVADDSCLVSNLAALALRTSAARKGDFVEKVYKVGGAVAIGLVTGVATGSVLGGVGCGVGTYLMLNGATNSSYDNILANHAREIARDYCAEKLEK
jgi:hypothetical protein